MEIRYNEICFDFDHFFALGAQSWTLKWCNSVVYSDVVVVIVVVVQCGPILL